MGLRRSLRNFCKIEYLLMKEEIEDVLTRYTDGVYTQSDAKNVLDCLNSDEETSLLEDKMDQLWNEYSSGESKSPALYQEYKSEAHQLLKRIQKPEKVFLPASLLKYAAAILVLFALGAGIYYMSADKEKSYTEISYIQIAVDKGKHKRIQLPDGTSVILNAGSVIRYPEVFDPETRLIELNGEAFFDVKKDASTPFIVNTQDADIRVLGTSFNIKAYHEDEQLMVSVQSGKVQVDMPESMTRLIANEQLLLDKGNGEFQKKKEDIKRVKSWIHGGLYFNRTPIHSVVLELQRMYNCEIVFDPHSVYDEYIYGEHDNKSLESVLKSIQYSTDIRFKKEGERYVLYKLIEN